jgi:hypothetical protein
MWILYIVGAYLLLLVISSFVGAVKSNRLTFSRELSKKEKELQRQENRLREEREEIQVIAREKSQGFPWLSAAYAEYFALKDLQDAEYLENKRVHPAPKAAELVRHNSHKRQEAERLWRAFKFKLMYYQALFPWLVDFDDQDCDDLIKQVLDRDTQHEDEGNIDPAQHWLSAAEFHDLPSAERNQLALDRYRARKKTRWEIGRDYERYIGHHYEMAGYDVSYQGIIEGLSDLGRDLVCHRNGATKIIQCKCWSSEKQIHEKHIFQLFGTVTAYNLDHTADSAEGILITSTELSPKAKQFAEYLKIQYVDKAPLTTYPCIKCNVSYRDGTKIYHLPFDQQYDRTTIDEERMERYVSTTAEAEALGFRRAYRWRGPALGENVKGATAG